MVDIIVNILIISFRDGLILFPMVLGVGFLYSYRRILDVSVDGISILSGLVCAVVWRSSESYVLSILVSVICGSLCSYCVCLVVEKLKAEQIMVGVVFSILVYAGSVLGVGESLSLPGTNLLSGFLHIPFWLPLSAFVLGGVSILLSMSRLGLEIQAHGGNGLFDTSYNPFSTSAIAYCHAGFLYGLSAALYVHAQGLARGGGGFEFLVFSLCSYLCIDRVFRLCKNAAGRIVGPWQTVRNSYGRRILLIATSSPAARALVGVLFFQVIVMASIVYAPNPAYWKLIMGSMLLIALIGSREPILHRGRSTMSVSRMQRHKQSYETPALMVEHLSKSYKIGSDRREVFAIHPVTFQVV